MTKQCASNNEPNVVCRICCHRDGAGLSTVLCALLIAIEQKKLGQVVDLSTAVQLVCLTRPQAVNCLVSDATPPTPLSLFLLHPMKTCLFL